MKGTISQCSIYSTVSSCNVAYSSWIKVFVKMCFLKFIAVNSSTCPDSYRMIGWLQACHILKLCTVHISGLLFCVIRLHTEVCTVSDILKYIHYTIFAHSTKQILLELKKISSLYMSWHNFSRLFIQISPTRWGSSEEYSLYNRRCGVCVSPLFVAQQTRIACNCRKTKQKTLKSKAAVRFTVIRRINILTCKYVNIKVNGKISQIMNNNQATNVY
jgi:hypothetical protein